MKKKQVGWFGKDKDNLLIYKVSSLKESTLREERKGWRGYE